MRIAFLSLGVSLLAAVSLAQQPSSFINFETAPVHPIALGPDGRTLAVCNLPDGRVELFDVSSGLPAAIGDVPVGVDPVSVRWRSTNELWVANYISRSISVVNVARRLVVDTLPTLDGPADIQFAGSPTRAFVSCAKENTVQVFDALTRQVITNLVIDGDRPKAMALSPDGSKLYVAIFESGNGSTILVGTQPDTDRILKHPKGPYGGQFPVPNDGTNQSPPLNANASDFASLLPDSLIVKKNSAGRWMDDNHGDWTEFISGTNAALSGRIPGWDLPDRDLAVIDTTTFDITYATGLMNLCMDLAVNPTTGRIAVIGTDGANERRFEPNLKGTFLHVNLALVEPSTLAGTIIDLNPHLDYSTSSVPQSVRDQSIGDPRGIVWNSAGTCGYVAGMGSRNLVIIDANGQRVGLPAIELGEGPSGLALDEPRQRLFVLNRFSASLSALNTATLNVVTNVAFNDPTPAAIKIGRKHLYDTRRNSGLGQVSCASCHPDARFDRLAWDLGDPRADISIFPGQGDVFHPMKGPMVTLTLQDIIVPEEFVPIMPLHWRGDRPVIESFNVTFTDLLARDSQLTPDEMQEFKNFLSTIHFAPNRFRNLDNSTPTNLPLAGFHGVDTNGVPDQTPLPNGNAVAGRELFNLNSFNGRFFLTMNTCHTCHNRASGRGSEGDLNLVGREANRPFRTAQLRSLTEKLGMDLRSTNSRAGFGLRFDGRAATLTDFFADVFRVTDNQAIADLTAFLVSIPGVGFGTQTYEDDSQDTHAAVGKQFTLRNSDGHPALPLILEMTGHDEGNSVELVARGVKDGQNRGWYFNFDRLFQSDRNGELQTLPELLALASPETPLTFTVLPVGSGLRLGVDRDEDGIFDRTEVENGFDPGDPLSHPNNQPPRLVLPPYLEMIHPHMTREVLFNGTDPDSPAQTLTFSLDPGAPTGTSINPTSGLFVWTPTWEQADVDLPFRVRVTDDGLPPLSDVRIFRVPVRSLRVVDIHLNQPGGTNLIIGSSVQHTTIAGRNYRLQYKERLESLEWSDVGEAVTATGGPIYLHDASATNAPQRFYRVVLVE